MMDKDSIINNVYDETSARKATLEALLDIRDTLAKLNMTLGSIESKAEEFLVNYTHK